MRRALGHIGRQLGHLARDVRGLMAIETAIVMPVLLLMALGTFEVGRIVSRQHELQSAASEAETIALAANMGATSNVETVKSIIKESVDLNDEQVSVDLLYRCGTDKDLVTTKEECGTDETMVVWTYMRLTLRDRYDPMWVKYGVGHGFSYDVVRQVQVS